MLNSDSIPLFFCSCIIESAADAALKIAQSNAIKIEIPSQTATRLLQSYIESSNHHDHEQRQHCKNINIHWSPCALIPVNTTMNSCLVEPRIVPFPLPGPADPMSRKRCLPFTDSFQEPKKRRAEQTKKRSRLARTLTGVLNQAKKEIGAMVGAIGLAERQLVETKHADECICCEKSFTCSEEKIMTIANMRGRIQQAMHTLKTSSSNNTRLKCTKINKHLGLNLPEIVLNSPVDMKTGERMAIRNQKQRVLVYKRCTLCNKELSTKELGKVLSKADRNLR